MNPETIQNFQRYEELKIQVRALEKEIEELAPLIIEHVPEDKELQMDSGYFYIQKRAKYVYSPKVKELETQFKDQKKREEADGTAKASYTPTLYYKTGTPGDPKETEY